MRRITGCCSTVRRSIGDFLIIEGGEAISPRQLWALMEHSCTRITVEERRCTLRLICFAGLFALMVLQSWAQSLERGPGGTDPNRYGDSSAEHAALSAASKYMRDVSFSLRQDYWKGEIKASAGKAIKLQLFHKTYISLMTPLRIILLMQAKVSLLNKILLMRRKLRMRWNSSKAFLKV